MLDQDVMAKTVADALVKQRSQWLSTGRGLVVIGFAALAALAAVATAVAAWVQLTHAHG